MKKTTGCLLLSCALGPAWGQSSLTLYGGVDLAIAHYRADGVGSRTQLISGGNQNNRIGVRGREDLGGGLFAAFELEAGFSPDSGAGLASNTNNQVSGVGPAQSLTFNRRSILSLGGSWGELRLGRDYAPSFWPLFLYDPFRTGVGFGGITVLGSTVTNLRVSNSIGYLTPRCDGIQCKDFFAQLMYAFGENPSGQRGADDGNVAGARIGYGGANWEVSIATTRTSNETVAHFQQTTGGGTYEASFARLMFLMGEHNTGRPVAALNNGTRAPFWQLGAMVYAGPGYIPVAYTRVKRNDAEESSAAKMAIGYVYNLSRRTAVYTTYARINNKKQLAFPVNVGADAGPAPLPGRQATGMDLGVRLVF